MGAPETIAFKVMIHRIHTGSSLTTPYTIYGGSGTPTSFAKIVFPGDRRTRHFEHPPMSPRPRAALHGHSI